jgi:formyltetrahydrofolate synthetase
MSLVEVYSAETTTDAHLIKGLLEQQGIDAFVSGHYLQGAFGELPVINMIQVMVEQSDESRAQQVLRDYEAGKFEIDDHGANQT